MNILGKLGDFLTLSIIKYFLTGILICECSVRIVFGGVCILLVSEAGAYSLVSTVQSM